MLNADHDAFAPSIERMNQSVATCELVPTISEPITKDCVDWSQRETAEGLEEITRFYYPWAQQMASLAIKHLASQADPDAIMSAAGYALLDAIKRFDPTKGISFRTFSTMRIRGAIFDEMRANDSLKRTARALVKARNAAESTLMAELGRNPTQEEICKHLGWTRKEFLYSLAQSHQSIDCKINNEFDRPETFQAVFGKCDPMGDVESSEAFEHMLRGFTMEEKTIMFLYYHRSATMKVIGQAIGLGESRVSQIHASIINRLRVFKRDR